MRIIAGSAKGTRLAPVPAGTRPLSDRAREGLFSSLGDRVAGTRVLDLFAGTGAIGIEALSRGAGEATFVERAHRAIATIRANLERTRLADRATVIRADFLRFLDQPPRQYDLVFLDPPYRYRELAIEIEGAISGLEEGWLAPGFTVAATGPKKGYIDDISVDWRIAKRLEYGDTVIVLYREV